MANKDMMSKNMDKWGYSYLIELKTLWEMEKLLVMSNFSFSHNVFKSCLLLMCQNEYLWSKGLNAIILDGWLVVWVFNATLTAEVTSWRSVTHMCFLAFSHQ